jgi:hypothetical protein
MPLPVRCDAAAEMAHHHLRTEADAQERHAFGKWNPDPVDLVADPLLLVVAAHGPAEDDGAGVIAHGLGERVAEARPPHVEGVPAFPQEPADAAGRRMFLMQNDKDLA